MFDGLVFLFCPAGKLTDEIGTPDPNPKHSVI